VKCCKSLAKDMGGGHYLVKWRRWITHFFNEKHDIFDEMDLNE